MRPIAMKAYAGIHPLNADALEAVKAVLRDWHIEDAVELTGDLLRISFEGDYFPGEDVAEALRPFLSQDSRGKLDVMDLDAWTLQRFFFDYGSLSTRMASLNQALESCSRPN